MEKESSQGYFLYLVLFLGLLNGFGPFVIDMYLPALPEMTHVFKTSASVIQLGLTFCMGGLAVGQVLLGPVSDRFGRKAVLLFSLFLYLSATVGCLCSESIWVFTFFRFLEGIGAAGGIVLSRSVATDLYHGRQLAKIIAFISAINGLAPIGRPTERRPRCPNCRLAGNFFDPFVLRNLFDVRVFVFSRKSASG